jgi:hypothetical protein
MSRPSNRRSQKIASAVAALLLSAAAVGADEKTQETSKDADELRVEDSAILPSAEGHLDSRAPTMDLDCENAPEDCVQPLERATEGPALSTPDDPSTTEVEASEGDPVRVSP